MKVWVKHFSRDGENNKAQIKLEVRKNRSDEIAMKDERLYIDAPEEWKEYQLSATVPEDAGFITVALVGLKGSKVMFDDVFLKIQGEERVLYDLTNFSHEFYGFGTQLWAYGHNPKNGNHALSRKQALQDMRIKFIRIENYLDRASWYELKSLRDTTDELGIKWVFVIWNSQRLGNNVIDSEKKVDIFATEWVEIVSELYKYEIPIEYIELMNEPDSKGDWSTGIDPYWYNQVVSSVRKKLNNMNFSHVGIIGPGLSDMKQSKEYIENISDENARNSLAVWSIHQWGGIEVTEWNRAGAPSLEYWWEKEFGESIKKKNKDLDVFVTEFSSDIRSINGVPHDPDNFGEWNDHIQVPNYSVTNTMPFAVRTYENALAFLNKGANATFFWQLNDEWPETNEKKKAWGFQDLYGNPKPVYLAMQTLAQNLPHGSKVLIAPDQTMNDLYTGAFITGDGKIIVGIANTTPETHSTTIFLEKTLLPMEVESAIAFVPLHWGDPSNGIPDEGVVAYQDDLQLKNNCSNNTSSFKVTLPEYSILTVVLMMK